MAGMLPGVECARRRRFHQTGRGGDSDSPSVAASHGGWTRRSSFCLYTSNHDSHHTTSLHRGILSQTCHDEKLGGIAREAKERLDEKLRTRRKSESKRHNKKSMTEEISLGAGRSGLQTEVYNSKNRISKRFSWSKFSWRSSDQEECVVCLDQFKVASGGDLVQLPCAHRFHGNCLVPWLENNSHCPCCRMDITFIN